jgi:PAS domain S-box-containing protein
MQKLQKSVKLAASESIHPGEVQARLAAIVDSANDAVISKTLEGIITSWNPAAERIFGYAADEMVGQSILKLIPPERIHEEREILEKLKRGESVEHYETVRMRKSGARVEISVTVSPVRDSSGRIVGASKIARDITERKLARKQLDASLKEIGELKAALDEHAIVAITDPRGQITYVNEKFCAISKYSRAELIGQDHRIINSHHHPREFMRDLWATIGQGMVWKGEIKNQAKDGSFYWVDTTIVPFLNADGKPYQYVAIRADITGRKLAEEELNRLNQELARRVRERTAELESSNHELEAFCYSVSHDLRAPLRHIDGFAELLRESAGSGLSDKSRRYLDQITSSAKQMGRLIDDLLHFSRTGRAEIRRSPLNLLPLVDGVVRDLKTETAGRDIQWKLGSLPVVQADAAMLRQALVNLLSNAVKYTRPRERAEIQVGCLSGEPGELVIFVRDNGVGFDMEYVDKLFGVFQRLHSDEEFEGTGIGLANVRRIIARHGGRVWAEGKVGEGATFFISLPQTDRT